MYNKKKYNLWSQYKANSELLIQRGESYLFKGDIIPTQADGIGTFTVSGEFSVSGNILTLIADNTICDYAFKHLFQGCDTLINAENLILPDTVETGCYEGMFKGCASLISAPVLKASTLEDDCYKELFYGCTLLDSISVYFEVAPSDTYTNNWVYGVAANGIFMRLPSVSWNETGNSKIPQGWSIQGFPELSYFTVESLVDNNTISIQNSAASTIMTVSYSTDNGNNWSNKTISKDTTQTIATIDTGERILFKSTNNQLSNAYNKYNKFNGSGNFKVYGNVMSLLYGDNFIDNSEFVENSTYNLCGLFYGTTTLIDASNLVLPATYCNSGCYNGMFRDCTNLSKGPKILPGITLETDAYSSMFETCINLLEGPEIYAMVFNGTSSMMRMFCMNRNSKITTPKMTKSPILPALNGSASCYREMFQGNGNLVEITCLLTSRVKSGTSYSTYCWTKNCGNGTGVFYKHPNADWGNSYGDDHIPSGWTIKNYEEK